MKVFEEWLFEKADDPVGDAMRDALKKAGYKRNQVSVSKGRGGYEIVYHVTVKDLMVPIEKIEKIVKKFQSVDWDERTGEILAGGNTMIFVEYDWKTVSAEEKRLEKPMKEVIAQGTKSIGEWIPVGKDFKLAWLDKASARRPETEYALMYKGKLIQRYDKKFVSPLWRVFLYAGM